MASIKKPSLLSPLTKPATPEELVSKYDKAIAASQRSGFLQDAALAAVLASNAVEDEYADRYIDLSDELWESWGARAVLSHLLDARQAVKRDSNASMSSSYRSRRRFTEGIQRRPSGFAVKRSSHFYVASPFPTPSARNLLSATSEPNLSIQSSLRTLFSGDSLNRSDPGPPSRRRSSFFNSTKSNRPDATLLQSSPAPIRGPSRRSLFANSKSNRPDAALIQSSPAPALIRASSQRSVFSSVKSSRPDPALMMESSPSALFGTSSGRIESVSFRAN